MSFGANIGMYLLVENVFIIANRHPVRDASLTGCKKELLSFFLPKENPYGISAERQFEMHPHLQIFYTSGKL